MNKSQKIREWIEMGIIDNTPSKKAWAAKELGMAVQTVHAVIVRYNMPEPPDEIGTDMDLKNAIEAKVNDCFKIARARGLRVLDSIEIKYDLKGRAAGQACFRYSQMFIRVNLYCARNNVKHYLAQTIPHEVAHIINRLNSNGGGHGRDWKRIMEIVFNLPSDRCHSYETQKSNRKTFAYSCDCKTYELTSIRHNRILRGTEYSCRICRTELKRK